MKKCDRFKDMILTDYIDGELSSELIKQIEPHLLECKDCSAFLKEVKNNTVMPFKQMPVQPVPAQLWDAITQRVEAESQRTSRLEELFSKIKALIVYPRMVPVFASVALMLLVGSVTLNTIQVQQAQAKDQGEYLATLLGSTGPSSQTDSIDLGTPIEHYFL